MGGTGSTRQGTALLAADEAGIARAAELLRGGGLVAFPTETVYGLGADATDGAALARLYAAKGRPRFNPLIVHLAEAGVGPDHGLFDAAARELAARLWPGPLTLVVPLRPGGAVHDLARAGLPSIALRVPAHPIARAILARAGVPIAAPSANRSGRLSPTRAADVLEGLGGRIDAVLDGGPCSVGVESTIVACLEGPPRLLRPGGIPREAIVEILGELPGVTRDFTAGNPELYNPHGRPPVLSGAPAFASEGPLAPGALASHYAPRAEVRPDAVDVRPGEAALLFGSVALHGIEGARAVRNLSPAGNLAEAAANLFAHLRFLDDRLGGEGVIAAAPVPRCGLGAAINDRLARAAAPRGVDQ